MGVLFGGEWVEVSSRSRVSGVEEPFEDVYRANVHADAVGNACFIVYTYGGSMYS